MSRPVQDRTGQTAGKLTVLKDSGGSQIQCRCECGREGMYPRAIFKPSYRGPKACPWCLGSPCEECGTIIPHKGRMPAKTCSKACRVARNNRREKERYQLVKDTEHFRAVRAAYLERLSEAMEADPELSKSLKKAQREAVRRWRHRQMADPALRERYLAKHREREAERLRKIQAEPTSYAAHLKKQRDWYRSLSDEDYRRIFADRNKRKKMKTTQKRWKECEVHMLGTDTDEAIAKKIGRTRSQVKNKRHHLKIPPFRDYEKKGMRYWSDAEISLLGTDFDSSVAKKLDRPVDSVTKKRREMGIQPFRKQRKRS